MVTFAFDWLNAGSFNTNCVALVGSCEISGSKSIFKFGVNGSGKRMFLGNADKTKLRSWTQFVGVASRKNTWLSQRNSGKSCNNTKKTLKTPL